MIMFAVVVEIGIGLAVVVLVVDNYCCSKASIYAHSNAVADYSHYNYS